MIHLLCPNPALDRTILVKKYEEGAANRPIEVKDYPGGKSFNVAYSIQKTGIKVPFKIHTLLGGHLGDYVEELAQIKNYPLVKTDLKNNTRICSIIANITSDEVYPLYEKGESINKEHVEQYTKNLVEAVETGDTIALSGSFLPGFPNDYLENLFYLLKDKNVNFCVDTSGEKLKQSFELNPKLIKINDEELLDIFPDFKGEKIEDYIHFFKTHWEQLSTYFIVTIGKEGVVAKVNNRLYHLKSKTIEAKNPIASGDFFFGTLISKLIEDSQATEDALISAISASTANCLNWYPGFTEEQFNYIKDTHITIKQYQ